MTVQDTDLTFTRCPACRSLVPATAPRCRMCGEQLGGEAQSKDDDPSLKKSRVRQRTMSVSQMEVEEMTTDEPEQAEYTEEDYPAEVESQDDYHESAEPYDEAGGDAGFRLDSRNDDTLVEQQSDVDEFSEAEPYPEDSYQDGGAADAEGGEKVWMLNEEDALPDASVIKDEPSLAERYAQRRGRDSEPAPSGESYSDSGSYESEPVVSVQEWEPEEDYSAPQEAEACSQEASQQEKVAPEPEAEAPKKKKRRRRRRKKKSADEVAAREADDEENELPLAPEIESFVPEEPTESPEAVAEEAVPEELEEIFEETQVEEQMAASVRSAGEGEILGWFVSYKDDERGSAIELRAGRFFLGSERLKPSDLVIKDQSISSPHCVIKVSKEDGLQVQDLLSEKGTFVRRRNEGEEFHQCEETTVLNHGDWVKIGDYEMLVCLLALPDA